MYVCMYVCMKLSNQVSATGRPGNSQGFRFFANCWRCCCLKKNLNAPRSSEHPSQSGGKMSKRLGGVIGCKDKTSS